MFFEAEWQVFSLVNNGAAPFPLTVSKKIKRRQNFI